MIEAKGITGSAVALGAATSGTAVSSRVESATKTETVAIARTPLSPRIKSDPAAGVMISEYLSSSGEKQAQIPSQAVVAYLRSGLTAEGLPVHKDENGLATNA